MPLRRRRHDRERTVGKGREQRPRRRRAGARSARSPPARRAAGPPPSPSSVSCSRMPEVARVVGATVRGATQRGPAHAPPAGARSSVDPATRRRTLPSWTTSTWSVPSTLTSSTRQPSPISATSRSTSNRLSSSCHVRLVGDARPAPPAPAVSALPRAVRSGRRRCVPPPAVVRCRAARPARATPGHRRERAARPVPSRASVRSTEAGCGRLSRHAVAPVPPNHDHATVASARSSELPSVRRCSSSASKPRPQALRTPRRSFSCSHANAAASIAVARTSAFGRTRYAAPARNRADRSGPLARCAARIRAAGASAAPSSSSRRATSRAATARPRRCPNLLRA